MIFGIKTRKDFKKEIEKCHIEIAELNKQLREYCHSESIRKVTIVPTTRPLTKLQACCIVPTTFYGATTKEMMPVDVTETLETEISKGLINYMDIDVTSDLFGLNKQIIGTLTVVVPEKGGIYDDSNSKIDIS